MISTLTNSRRLRRYYLVRVANLFKIDIIITTLTIYCPLTPRN